MKMLILEHCLRFNICSWDFINFSIFSLIQVWFLSSGRKETSLWKPWPSFVWREDRTISLQGLFSYKGYSLIHMFKCNQKKSQSWRFTSPGPYVQELQNLKFHIIEICQFNLIVTMCFVLWSSTLKCCSLLSLEPAKTWFLLLSCPFGRGNWVLLFLGSRSENTTAVKVSN